MLTVDSDTSSATPGPTSGPLCSTMPRTTVVPTTLNVGKRNMNFTLRFGVDHEPDVPYPPLGAGSARASLGSPVDGATTPSGSCGHLLGRCPETGHQAGPCDHRPAGRLAAGSQRPPALAGSAIHPRLGPSQFPWHPPHGANVSRPAESLVGTKVTSRWSRFIHIRITDRHTASVRQDTVLSYAIPSSPCRPFRHSEPQFRGAYIACTAALIARVSF